MKECLMGEKCDCKHNRKGCKAKVKVDTLVCPPICVWYEQRPPEIKQEKPIKTRKGVA
ncbi:MAG: hypothetical protein H6Q73_2553 [Firmicutes bacterium]|nr:hypothetical protein [Bacillota bacterium]